MRIAYNAYKNRSHTTYLLSWTMIKFTNPVFLTPRSDIHTKILHVLCGDVNIYFPAIQPLVERRKDGKQPIKMKFESKAINQLCFVFLKIKEESDLCGQPSDIQALNRK